jgi:hypothetical protein
VEVVDLGKLMSIDKKDLPEAAMGLEESDLPQLVELLSEKDDTIRYQVLLLLQHRSSASSDVYPFWEVFKGKLSSDNSYQRSIGLTLIAENAKWDAENRMDTTVDAYLRLLNDEKPITVRQCIQALGKIVPVEPGLCSRIAKKLMAVDLNGIKETMRKLILTDILFILALILKQQPSQEVRDYIAQALSGDILDKKAKKQVEALM